MNNIEYREHLINQIPFVNYDNFEYLALQVFRYQAIHNIIYNNYLKLLKINILNIKQIEDIPFLPIELFKKLEIKTGNWKAEKIFISSGTSGQSPSKHHITSLNWYLNNCKRGFEQFFGTSSKYCFLCLLPSYLERQGSSLVAMADFFINNSNYSQSGFFLYNYSKLIKRLQWAQENKIPTILFGVSFALLDLAEKHPMNLSDVIIMDTGGMKGKRKEIIRTALHEILTERFQVLKIYSEYGMTELLSQGYSLGEGQIKNMNTLKFYISDLTDPFCFLPKERNGLINIIDLANLDSCAFIQTQDVGRIHLNDTLEVLGRVDNSDIRGCNLMVY